MNTGRNIFAQLVENLPIRRFHTLTMRYKGDYKNRKFSCHDHLLAMVFAQLASCDSLRDIEAGLSANPPKLYHLGIRCRIRRSTLADADERRDARIFEEFGKLLIAEARCLYAEDIFFPELNAVVYAFDSTTVSLCLELFPWAAFRRRKAAIKLHTLIDLRGNIPSFVLLSPGKMHDVKSLDHLPIDPGAFYLMDRGYLDYQRLYRIHQAAAFFITRLKDNSRFHVVESFAADKSAGILCDQAIRLSGAKSASAYPERLRRVKYRDPETNIVYEFLTNNFTLPARI
ncbi:MAG: IS4 family transposase, partial [Planctomycetota bacterium]|nr:IS4 family transposase [Planctomycetota bacterium]